MLSNDSEHVLKVSSCSDEWVASTVPDRSFVDGKFSAIELYCIFFRNTEGSQRGTESRWINLNWKIEEQLFRETID